MMQDFFVLDLSEGLGMPQDDSWVVVPLHCLTKPFITLISISPP